MSQETAAQRLFGALRRWDEDRSPTLVEAAQLAGLSLAEAASARDEMLSGALVPSFRAAFALVFDRAPDRLGPRSRLSSLGA